MCCFAIQTWFHRSVIALTLKRSLDNCRYFTEGKGSCGLGQGRATQRKLKGEAFPSPIEDGGAPCELWGSTRPCEQGSVRPGLSECGRWSQLLGWLHRPASSILHAHLTLKGTPVLAWLPGRLDYRITFSPPGWAMGNPLSSLSLDINNPC